MDERRSAAGTAELVWVIVVDVRVGGVASLPCFRQERLFTVESRQEGPGLYHVGPNEVGEDRPGGGLFV